MTMFVERVAAIHRGTKTTEVKAEIFNAVVKYFLLMALLDMGVGGEKVDFLIFCLCICFSISVASCAVFPPGFVLEEQSIVQVVWSGLLYVGEVSWMDGTTPASRDPVSLQAVVRDWPGRRGHL